MSSALAFRWANAFFLGCAGTILPRVLLTTRLARCPRAVCGGAGPVRVFLPVRALL